MHYLITPITGVLSLVFLGFIVLLPCYVYWVGYKVLGAIYFAIWIIAFISTLLRCFTQRVTINEIGVKYKSLTRIIFLKWDEITDIGVKRYCFLVPSKQEWIYFSTEKLSCKYLYGKPNEKLILLHYRKSIITDIKNYWHGDIN